MKTQVRIRKIGLAILVALFLLCSAAAVIAVAPQTQTAFAESTEPASFEVTAFLVARNTSLGGLTIKGIDKENIEWQGMSADQKANIKISIPEKYTFDGQELPVVEIGTYAFSKFFDSTLKEYTFKSLDLTKAVSLKKINYDAFRQCEFEGTLTIPKSVTEIGDDAFRDCNRFTKLEFEQDSQLTTINKRVFMDCSGFKGELNLPTTVGAIGEEAFSGCSGFTGTLTIPDGVTTLTNEVFKGCVGFTGVLTIPESLTTLNNSPFSGCTGLETIYLPQAPINFNTFLFQGVTCPIVASKTEYNKLKDIILFGDSRQYLTYETTVTFNENGGSSGSQEPKLYGYSFKYEKGNQGIWAENPDYKLPIAEKAGNLFNGWYANSYGTGDPLDKDTSLVARTTYYAKYTVLEFLATYLIDEGGYRIDGFNPDYINTLSDEAKQKVAISIPETFNDGVNQEKPVTAIGNNAFNAYNYSNYNCMFTSLDLSGATNLTTIGDKAFFSCVGLKTLKLPTNGKLTTIGESAFNNCWMIEGALTIPNTVTTIGESAFKGCEGFTSLTFADGSELTTIGNYAFNGCKGFTGTLTIPNTVTTIGASAFGFCEGFTGSLEMPNSVTTIGDYAFNGCEGFTGSLTIPNSVTKIGGYAFNDCKGLETVYLPKNAEVTVGEATFGNTTTLIVAANKEDYEKYKVMENLAAHVPPTENSAKLTYETTVTFDSDGGIVGETAQTKLFGYPLNYEKNAETKVWAADEGYTLPSATKQNYIFKGWKTAVAEGEAVSASTVVADAPTYKANYIPVEIASITAVFAPNGNTIYTSATLESLKQYLTVDGTNNDSSEVKGISDYVLSYASGKNGLDAGENTITVTVNGKVTTTFQVNVTAVALESIKAEFNKGENTVYASAELDSLKQYLTVNGTNNDGTSAGAIRDYTLSGDLKDGGEVTVTVSFSGKQTTFQVNVTAVALESIKAEFNQGEIAVYPSTSMDTFKALLEENSALTLKGINNDGTDFVITEEYTLTFQTGEVFTVSETQIVVSYRGKTTGISVTVTAKMLTSIEITSQPTKKIYTAFDEFDADGMEVTAQYNDGIRDVIQSYTVKYAQGNNSFRYGENSVTVAYTENEVEKTAVITGITVQKKLLTKPASTVQQYSGKEQKASLVNYDANTMTATNDTRKDAGNQQVNVALKDKINYAWDDGTNEDLELLFSIERVELTPNVLRIDAKTYDGTTSATGALSLSGAVNGEVPTATGTFVWTGADAKTTTFNVTNITLDDSWSNNYELSVTILKNKVFGEAMITAATITNNNAFTDFSDTYNKTAYGIGYDASKISVTNSQSVTVYYRSSSTENWGTEPITVTNVTGVPVTVYWKVSAPNHTDITGSNNVTVTPKPITVTADAKQSIHKATLKELTYQVDPELCTGDSFTGSLACDADKDSVNTYQILQGTLSAGENYKITFTVAEYKVIAKDNVTITQTAQSYPYDGVAKKFAVIETSLKDFTVEYFVGGTYTETAPVNVGSYNVKVTRAEDDNYYAFAVEIENGLIISVIEVDKPAKNETNFEYTGELIVYELAENKAYEISGNSEIDAGKYDVTVTLNNPEGVVNYRWSDGGTEVVRYEFIIGKKPTEKPVISGYYEYSGSQITANVVTTDAYTVEGNQKTEADTYTVTVTLAKNYKWNDGSENQLELTWTIAQKKLSITPLYDNTVKVFVGGSLPEISEASGLGTIRWDDYTLTEAAEQKAFGWSWTPNDEKNYVVVTGTVNFDVLTVQLESIKAEFNQGENTVVYASAELDSLKQYLTVIGTNNDGTSAGEIDDYTLSGDLKDGGEVTVTVSFSGKQTTFQVNVTAVALESIKAKFDQGENKIYTSATLESLKQYLTVIGTNNDGTSAGAISDYTLSGNLKDGGEVAVTVSFSGKQTTFQVNVTAVALESIKAEFNKGENTVYASAELDSLKQYLTVNGTNNDGTSAGAIRDYTLSGDLKDGGEVTVTVSFSGKQTTFQVNVTAVALERITAEFEQGENKIYTVDSLDKLKTWLTVSGTNNDGTVYQGTIDYVLSGALSAGSDNIITVTVKDTEISTTFHNVEVTAVIIESIAVTAQPTKTAYTAKEDFDAAGMVVTATFNYGTKVVTDYVVENRNALQAGTTSLTVKYTFDGATKTTTVSVSVAKIQLAKPTVSGKYSYTGGEQEVALNGFDENTMSIVSGNKFTNAGDAYAVVIGFKDAANYEWNDGSAGNLSLSWAIAKKTVTAPVADATQFVYNGQEQTYAIANSDFYTVQGNKQTAANSWTVTVSLNDKSNTEWSDGGVDDVTFAFVIGKASFDMSGVTFDDITVKEDGNVHKLEVSGLPQGVTVTYNGTNGYTADGVSAVGVYVVTATFAVTDTQNYLVPEAIAKTLTINAAVIIGGETNEKGDAEIIIDSSNGVKPGTQVKVSEKSPESYRDSNIVAAGEKQSIMQVTDIKLEINGAEIQPDGSVTVRMLIRPDLRGYANLKIFYIAPDNSVEDMNAVREGDYMVFETTHFSVYAIVMPQSQVLSDNTGLGGGAIFGIVFAVIVVVFILALLLLFLFRKDKSVGFKKFYTEIYKNCTAGVKNLFKKDKTQNRTKSTAADTEEEITEVTVENVDKPEDKTEE